MDREKIRNYLNGVLFGFEGTRTRKRKRRDCNSEKGIVGVNDDEDPPVPIPNTVVKLVGAEDTWLETTRENRTMPTYSFFAFI